LLVKKASASQKLFLSADLSLASVLLHLHFCSLRALVAHVHFVDVVTTMQDVSIPLTTNEFDEWGNPRQKAYYDYMLSYSPYDQVKKQQYPAMLVTTALHDSRVQHFEPATWGAKLRANKTDQQPLLFRTNMEAGRFSRMVDIAGE
jgi:oligopeptidase B